MTGRAAVIAALAVTALAVAPATPPLLPKTVRSAVTAGTTSSGFGIVSLSVGWRPGARGCFTAPLARLPETGA